MTGSTAGINHQPSVTLTLDAGGVVFTLASGGKYLAQGETAALSFTGTTATTTITTASNVMGNVTFNGTGGGWELSDAWTSTSTAQVTTLPAGSLDFNSFEHTFGKLSSSGTGARAIYMDSSDITLQNNGDSPIDTTTTTTYNYIRIHPTLLACCSSISYVWTGNSYSTRTNSKGTI